MWNSNSLISWLIARCGLADRRLARLPAVARPAGTRGSRSRVARAGPHEPGRSGLDMIGAVPVLSPDELLATTRSVWRRLDLTRPVERGLIEECLRLAQQAPSGGNRQWASFVVVTDPERRRALGDLYRRGWDRYLSEGILGGPPRARTTLPSGARRRASAARPPTSPSTWARSPST